MKSLKWVFGHLLALGVLSLSISSTAGAQNRTSTAGILHLELGAANYAPQALTKEGIDRRYAVLVASTKRLIKEYGASGTIYLNDRNVEGLGFATEYLRLWLIKNNYPNIQLVSLPGRYSSIKLQHVKTANLSHPDTNQLPSEKNIFPVKTIEQLAGISETGLRITSYMTEPMALLAENLTQSSLSVLNEEAAPYYSSNGRLIDQPAKVYLVKKSDANKNEFSDEAITQLLEQFQQDLKEGKNYPHWFVSNELYPQEAKTYYARAQVGWHFALGSERGFIGFAANPMATGLVLADKDAGVLLFNIINRALLRLAKDRAHFVDLREDVNLWKPALFSAAFLTAGERRLLKRTDIKEFWDKSVANESTFALLDGRIKQNTPASAQAFGELSYPKDDILFDRVQAAAKKDLIIIKKIDLNDLKSVEDFLKELSEFDKIGLMDISNAWQENYISNSSKAFLFSLLYRIGSTKTLFVGTTAARVSDAPVRGLFTYFAIPLSKVQEQTWFTEGNAFDKEAQRLYIQSLMQSCDSVLASILL